MEYVLMYQDGYHDRFKLGYVVSNCTMSVQDVIEQLDIDLDKFCYENSIDDLDYNNFYLNIH